MYFPGVGVKKVKWFFVDHNRVLDVPTIYNSRNWLTEDIRPAGSAGEVEGAARTWSNGRKPDGDCTTPKGSANAWKGKPSPVFECEAQPTAKGGIELCGHSLLTVQDSFAGSGGVVFGGEGRFRTGFAGRGGLIMGGTGSFRPSWRASGGITMNGSGSWRSSWKGRGGIVLNGSGSFRPSWTGSGGIEVNGSGSFRTSWAGTGGIEFGGEGTFDIGDSDVIPPGIIVGYGNTTPPSGWLVCDGSAVSRATYAALFAVIGGSFGVGDGSTTFNLPDFRGRTMIGSGTGTGLTARGLAATVGTEGHTLSTAELPAHSHGMNSAVKIAGTTFPYNAGLMTPPGFDVIANSANAGGGGSHNNMQPSLVACIIIKF